MKKWLVFLLFAATYWAGQSQTLQFSKVLLVGTTPQTVPSGKVWKISQANFTSIRWSSSSGPREFSILVNGVNRFIGHSANYYSSETMAAFWDIDGFWLPDGTTLAAGTNVGDLSVIEFTIIP